ncbi:MAG TPA: outer membrane beta-barrel protein, partial [Stellaceae bacterium]|nr:outer membrane beta-barrel protein [Stellaceae bacterium]
ISLSGFSLPARVEWIASTGHSTDSTAPFNLAANPLGYGANSKAWSLTITPTYQYKIFFARTEFSFVKAYDVAPFSGFGTAQIPGFGPATDNDSTQFRALVEAGLAF